MFASYAQDPDLKINDVSPPTSKAEFEANPEKLCTEIVVTDHTTQTRYHYKVQDTPGYDSMEVRSISADLTSSALMLGHSPLHMSCSGFWFTSRPSKL